jgi:ABC-type transport system involved in multi-copper enzyme maturation permease subunit
MRQMVWIALGLLALTVAIVAAVHYESGWGMSRWRYPRRGGIPYSVLSTDYTVQSTALPFAPETAALHQMGAGAFAALLKGSSFLLFSRWVMFSLFVSFLLPLWSLSFATEALGGEREARTLVWLLSRPLPRPAIYLAKFVGLLPWCLGLNLGGFALICLAAGEPGRLAFRLFWPAVLMASLAFVALFHFIAAWARRPTVVALVYSFFLEVMLGDMPGLMKRVSISFYTRCLMFDAAADFGLTPDKPHVYLPVSGEVAWAVLIGVTGALLAAGMYVFSKAEYPEET